MGGSIYRLPLHPTCHMARKSKMFKQISNVHLETVANQDWSTFLKLEKQDPNMRSAYVDKVRISWVVDSDEQDGDDLGLLFCASYDKELDSSTPANNDGQIIAATARYGVAGVSTLDIKRRITINYDGSDGGTLNLLEGTAGAPIWLHAYKANNNQSTNFYLVIETWGRWFSAETL